MTSWWGRRRARSRAAPSPRMEHCGNNIKISRLQQQHYRKRSQYQQQHQKQAVYSNKIMKNQPPASNNNLKNEPLKATTSSKTSGLQYCNIHQQKLAVHSNNIIKNNKLSTALTLLKISRPGINLVYDDVRNDTFPRMSSGTTLFL
jgi:hypothetical protein